jgi:hypothetical protein
VGPLRKLDEVFSGVSLREDLNEAFYPRARQSIERMPGGFIDVVFGLVYVLLRELLLQAWQRISAASSNAFVRPALKIFPLTRIISQLKCGM